MNIKDYIMYRNAQGNPGSAWVAMIQSSDEYVTLSSGRLHKNDPLYVRYAKVLYDEVDKFFDDLSKEINLSSDINTILLFIANMGQYCMPFLTKRVISLYMHIIERMDILVHVDIVHTLLNNTFLTNVMLDNYLEKNKSEEIHRFFFIINTSTEFSSKNLETILFNYRQYLKTKNVNEEAIMNRLNSIRNI